MTAAAFMTRPERTIAGSGSTMYRLAGPATAGLGRAVRATADRRGRWPGGRSGPVAGTRPSHPPVVGPSTSSATSHFGHVALSRSGADHHLASGVDLLHHPRPRRPPLFGIVHSDRASAGVLMALPARWIHEQQSVGQGVRGDVFTTDFDVESSEIGPRYLRGGWSTSNAITCRPACESPRVHADAAAGIDHRADAGPAILRARRIATSGGLACCTPSTVTNCSG